jgi:hypothetical protein
MTLKEKITELMRQHGNFTANQGMKLLQSEYPEETFILGSVTGTIKKVREDLGLNPVNPRKVVEQPVTAEDLVKFAEYLKQNNTNSYNVQKHCDVVNELAQAYGGLERLMKIVDSYTKIRGRSDERSSKVG